jgi:O-acetyl-ADP-ribose deacetylase
VVIATPKIHANHCDRGGFHGKSHKEQLMVIAFIHGDIVEQKAQGLICSGNINLNMSGGVNGTLLSRGGQDLQRQLHQYLKDNSLNFVQPGFVMEIGPGDFPFKCIVYSVAIDCWYESSVELVRRTLVNALSIIEGAKCRTVNVPALGAGYGHLNKPDFGRALRIALGGTAWVGSTSDEKLLGAARICEEHTHRLPVNMRNESIHQITCFLLRRDWYGKSVGRYCSILVRVFVGMFGKGWLWVRQGIWRRLLRERLYNLSGDLRSRTLPHPTEFDTV